MGRKRLSLRADRAKRHQDHRLVGQLRRHQSVQHYRQVLFDVLGRRIRKHLADHRNGDRGNCGNNRGRRHKAQCSRRLRTHHAIGGQPGAALESRHSRRSSRTERAIGCSRIEAACAQLVLQIGNLGATASLL